MVNVLPFSRDAFLDLFTSYNQAVWPAQAVAYGLGLLALLALVRSEALFRRVAFGALVSMWAWTGIAYHWLFFAAINGAAYAFGLLFIIQGILFANLALRDGSSFRFRRDPGGMVGIALVAYSMLLYPMIGILLGEGARTPAFGVTPCPVTLFTFGLLLQVEPRPRLWTWIVPTLWSLIGGTAAFLLGVVQDWILLLTGPVALWLAFGRGRSGMTRMSRG